MTGSAKDMVAITVIFHVARSVLYYIHERIWEHISWGRIVHPLSGIAIREIVAEEDLEIIKEQLRELGVSVD